MTPIRRILVPTDFSDCSAKAAEYACDFARRLGASVELLNVIETAALWSSGAAGLLADAIAQIRASAAEQLEAFAGKHFAGVELRRHVREGNPVLEVIRAAEEFDCNLIVAGTHGRTGMAHFIIGSVAENLVRKSRIPVLTVRE